MVKTLVPVLVLWVIVGSYVAWQLDSGWIPHDEGTLAHSAERALSGELPHRDFDEGYTGGLTFLHAAALWAFGVNLLSLRLVLLLFVLAWVPALFFIASRFVGPLAAGATVLLAVAWSVPTYPASMPSWYNLFFATFGAAGLLLFVDSGRRRWLVIAGLCAGISCLVKIVGLYFVAGTLLFLAFDEQTMTRVSPFVRSRSSVYRVFSAASLLLFVFSILFVLGDQLGAREFVHFVLPLVILVGLFAWREWTHEPVSSSRRFAHVFKSLVPFAVGLAFPVALYFWPYVSSGSVSTLLHGVFVAPMERLSSVASRPPSLFATTVALLPLLELLRLSSFRGTAATRLVAGTAATLGLILLLSTSVWAVYRFVWFSVRLLVPAVTIIGAGLLIWSGSLGSGNTIRARRLLVLLCVTAPVSLVQFPFSQPVYFTYVAPLVALSAVAIVSSLPVGRGMAAAVLCFYLLFGVRDNQSFIYRLGFSFAPSDQTEMLSLDRGGLRVSREEKEEYEALVPLLRRHAKGGFVYAAPDCPEVYFLSALRNPTRTFFDVFDDPTDRTARVLGQIEDHGVRVIAINQRPHFSGQMPADLLNALVDRFPEFTEVGRFQVRWKE